MKSMVNEKQETLTMRQKMSVNKFMSVQINMQKCKEYNEMRSYSSI
jgi:hypothetical protein